MTSGLVITHSCVVPNYVMLKFVNCLFVQFLLVLYSGLARLVGLRFSQVILPLN